MKYLFIFAIGPVQEFIATARRSRDLWFGSWMLSELAKAAARKLEEISPGCLIFPAVANSHALDPGSDFTSPNKIVALLDRDNITEEIRRVVKARLDQLWSGVRDKIKEDGGRIDENIAKQQIDGLTEFFWVSVPFDENSENAYQKARALAERTLAARKVTRDFTQPDWSSDKPKSSLDGARESVIPPEEYPGRNNPNEKEKIEQLYVRYRARRGEQLSGVDLLKRLGEPGLSPKFKSTSDMAAIPFIQAIDAKKGVGKGVEMLVKIGALLPLSADVLDGAFEGLVFESRFADGFPTQRLVEKDKKRKELLDYQVILKEYAGTMKPNPYYALLAADGDNMGKLIDAMITVKEHQALSKAMSEFAASAQQIVNGRKGICIYSGGDDVLAYLPLDSVLDCAAELHEKFGGLLGGFHAMEENGTEITPTLSVGVAITHHVDPLSDALELARKAEKDAKALDGKNGLAIIVSKRSGADRAICGKWGVFDERLEALIQLYRQGVISGGTAYELQELQRVLAQTSVPVSGIALEAIRIVARKKEAGGTKGISDEVKGKFRRWIQDEKIALDELAREMIIAKMLAGNIETEGKPEEPVKEATP
jgi:CRISPR-associated protein Cmr2